MSNSVKKIHFINRLYYGNLGDWMCSPINWYFEFFKNYNVIRHDISAIDWHVISEGDIVILGGGGLVYASVNWNRDIARLVEITQNVITWGVGFNLQSNILFHSRSGMTYLDFNKMKLVSIRDYEHESGYHWIPCVTCKIPELNKKSEIKRKYGIIEHANFPIKGEKYDRITNAYTIREITDFIASTEVVISNAYHMIYFAQLMGKSVICVNPFSDKFNYLKYKPPILTGRVTEKRLIHLLETSKRHPSDILEEAIKLNDLFFESVKEIIIAEIPEPDNSYSMLYNVSFGGAGSIRRELMDIRERTKIPNFLTRLFGVYSIKKQWGKLMKVLKIK